MSSFPRMAQAMLCGSLLLAASALPAAAQPAAQASGQPVVFVQSNDPTTNQVLVYHRAADGTLSRAAAFATGGQGGRLMGAVNDPLGSQGSLRLDADHNLLIGVNAGSNTIYAFSLNGDRLGNRQVLDSGGEFPVSVAVHGDRVYALNARGTGSVSGFHIASSGQLSPIPNSTRDLGLTPNPTPTEFVTSPGQVGFTPDGSKLLVTTKASTNQIDVFQVRDNGTLSAAPVMNPSQTPVPFAFTFDPLGHLIVGEAGTSNVSTYLVGQNGTLTAGSTATDGQVALCWIAQVGNLFLVSNTGSDDMSSFQISPSGQVTPGVTTPVGPGPVDIGVPSAPRLLYVLLGGNGTIAELRVNGDGTLSSLGSVAGHVGEEGIVAL